MLAAPALPILVLLLLHARSGAPLHQLTQTALVLVHPAQLVVVVEPLAVAVDQHGLLGTLHMQSLAPEHELVLHPLECRVVVDQDDDPLL